MRANFKDAVFEAFGEFGRADSYEFCSGCHDLAVRLIEEEVAFKKEKAP